MMLISCFNYQFYKRPVMQRLIVTAMIVCAGIALVLGVSSMVHRRWIEVGGIQLQPSEIVKLLIILYLPSVCVKHPKYLTSYQGIIRLIAPCIVQCGSDRERELKYRGCLCGNHGRHYICGMSGL